MPVWGSLTKDDRHLIVLCGLSMSLGWRIRGQFGHEIGAAIAGALGAMAIVLLSGRRDWWSRVHYFGLFGALGWAFGGSMSYMKVVGYCHSSDSATVLYGFGGLFLIGFLWAALGGAGTAIPAALQSRDLGSLFPVLAAAFSVWFLQDLVADVLRGKFQASVAWLGSDWATAILAIAACLAIVSMRRRIELGSSLVLHLAIGWLTGMAVLVLALDLHLSPPRGDTWAVCVGLFAALMVFCRRRQLAGVAMAALLTGILGGVGFALGQAIKLALIANGVTFGWHAVMEWTHGLFFGLGLATALLPLIRRTSERDGQTLPRWMSLFAMFFLMWAIPYLNAAKSPAHWVTTLKSVNEHPYGVALTTHFLPTLGWIGWIEMVYIALAAALAWLLIRQGDKPCAVVPENALGRAQLLYLAFLWAFVIISFVHAEAFKGPAFAFLIQFVITMHGIVSMVLALAWSDRDWVREPETGTEVFCGRWRKTIVAGLAAAVLTSVIGWGVKLTLFGHTFTGYYYADQIRFGPNNTNHKR